MEIHVYMFTFLCHILGCENIGTTVRHFELFSLLLSCSPYTLYIYSSVSIYRTFTRTVSCMTGCFPNHCLFVCLSICLYTFVHLLFTPSVCPPSIYVFICLSVCLSVCMHVCMYVCLCVHLINIP